MKGLVAAGLAGVLALLELLFKRIRYNRLNLVAQILSRPLLRNRMRSGAGTPLRRTARLMAHR